MYRNTAKHRQYQAKNSPNTRMKRTAKRHLSIQDKRRISLYRFRQRQIYRENWERWKKVNPRTEPKRKRTMDETLQGLYKELWIEYQNQESIEIQNLSYDQLIERIKKWEAIEFEAKARRQRNIAERRQRDIAKGKAERDSLITDPYYTPTKQEDSRQKIAKPYTPKEPKVKRTKEEKLNENFGMLGLNLADLLADVTKKK